MTQEQKTPITIAWELSGKDQQSTREKLRTQYLAQAFLNAIGADYSSSKLSQLGGEAYDNISYQLYRFVSATNQLNKKIHEVKTEYPDDYAAIRGTASEGSHG